MPCGRATPSAVAAPSGWGACKPACKPGSVPAASFTARGPPLPGGGGRPSIYDAGCPAPAAARPGTWGEQPLDGEPSVPVRPCSGRGLTWPAGHPAAGGLLPHHFTVAAAGPRLCHFCGTLLRVAPTGRYPAPCSVEPGLSSDDERPRPSGRLARRFYRRSSREPSTHRAPLDAPASAAHLRRPFERADQHICSH